jgi:hypothetical protein
LTIEATGVVTFNQALTLTHQGALTIRGASSVVFANGVTVQVDGDVTIDAKSLALMGGANSLSTTGGVLTITSATTGTTDSNITVSSSTSSVAASGALNLSNRELEAIGNGFSKVVIGEVGTGAVTLAGNTDLTSVAGVAVTLQGETITVAAGASGSAVQMPADVSLQASGNITLNAGLGTAGLNKVTINSTGGNVTMAGSTRIDSRGGDVSVRAANSLALAEIYARSSDHPHSGVVEIHAGTGTVTDANNDSAANIFAKAINFSGYGPVTSSGGNVLEAVAEVVHIDVPSGSVVRHSDADGRTYFDVVRAGHLYEQIVVVGNVTRVTEDLKTLLQNDADWIAAGIPVNSSLWASPVAIQSVTPLLTTSQNFAFNTAVGRYLAPMATSTALQGDVVLEGIDLGLNSNDLLSDSSYGLASRLEQSYVLGTPGAQPLISGLDNFSQDNFEYWVDSLSL